MKINFKSEARFEFLVRVLSTEKILQVLYFGIKDKFEKFSKALAFSKLSRQGFGHKIVVRGGRSAMGGGMSGF